MILKGDCIKVMKAMKQNSVDAIVTDPPYGLEFMGKEWDKLIPDSRLSHCVPEKMLPINGGKEFDARLHRLPKGNNPANPKCLKCGHYKWSGTPCKCKTPTWSDTLTSYNKKMQLWHTQWLTEAYRVLKPGGSMLVMGGTRTSHRLACAIEDTGFIIKDTLMYLYGSGFPKAQDLTKMLEKRNAKKATEQDTKYNLRFMRKADISQTISNKKTKENTVQSGLSKQGISEYRKEGSESEITNGEQSCMEGRSNLFQEERKLQERSLHKSSTLGNADGKERRLHNGTSIGDGPEIKQVTDKRRSNSPHRSQSSKQPTKESNVIQEQSGTQDLGRWDGFKVGGIKPAYEPIIWAVKPPEGSYVDNVLKWGVGAVNVDECRVGYQDKVDYEHTKAKENKSAETKAVKNPTSFTGTGQFMNNKGRFPANIILSHHPECVQVGVKSVKNKGGVPKESTEKNVKPAFTSDKHTSTKHYFDKDYQETVESWDCHLDCAVRMLDEQSGNLSQVGGPKKTIHDKGMFGIGQPGQVYFDGNSGASRFFYCAKASRSERNAGLEGMEEKDSNYRTDYRPRAIESGDKGQDTPFAGTNRSGGIKNNHPTVKPIKLFEWLIKLVTREGQIILDPFIGSGTTAIASHNVGRKCVGIEKEEEYLEIARRRAAHWRSRPKQLEMTGG